MDRSGFIHVTRRGNASHNYAPAHLEENIDEENIEHTDTSLLADTATMNAFQEINRGSVNDAFVLKQKVYESNDAFFDVDKVPETTDENIRELQDAIKQGQKLLNNEILQYSALKAELELASELKLTFNDNIVLIKRTLMYLEELQIHQEDYKNDVNNIHQIVDKFDKKIKDYFESSTVEVKKEYEVSFNKLLQLKDVYGVLHNQNNTTQCKICFNRQVDLFLVPCGHTFCQDCVTPDTKRCHICRLLIHKLCNLFFS